MIAETTTPRSNSRRNASIKPDTTPQTLDIIGALWRYRWAVILPAIVFGVIGFLVYLRTDETYRSSTRLMVESNRPGVLDTLTGEVVGAVPDVEVLQAQLFSDTVAGMAFNDPNMLPFRDKYDDNLQVFIKEVQDQLELEPEVTDVKAAQSLITLLHFDSPETEHCEAAIRAYSKALQEFYNARHKSSRGELIRMIELAIKQLDPKLEKMQRQYTEFRRDAPLVWGKDGEAINPYREEQKHFTEQRSLLSDQLRRTESIFERMKAIAASSESPRVTLNVFSNLLDAKVGNLVQQREPDPVVGDTRIAELDLEKNLIPLIVQRNQLVNEFGPSHPTVQALDEELTLTRKELLRVVREQSERVTSLREQWFSDMGDPVEQAKEVIQSVLISKDTEVKMLKVDIKYLDEQIASKKLAASKLTHFERDNEQMLIEIERHQDFMSTLEENMSKAQLADEESVTQIVELMSPTPAYLIGPSLVKMGGAGTLLGLLLGSGLALLLEKNANTFRDPEEIARLLDVPILTHIPFFRGKRRKIKKGEVDPYKTLSTDLAVVHQPSSIAAEAIRSLRTAVFFDTSHIKTGKVLQITSPLPGDGKSTIACNLACSIAQSGKRVLAIDCDLRRPQLTDNFDCDDRVGLTSILNGECDPLDAAHQTPLPNLSIMPCGPIPSNPAEALSLSVMNELLDYLRDRYDFIILDTPPLLVVTDPSITASMADALIMTLRVRRKSKPNSREALNILSGVGANVLGVVINNSDEAGASDGYRGYGYYKYGRYGGQYYRGGGKGQSTSVAVSTDRGLRQSRPAMASTPKGPVSKAAVSKAVPDEVVTEKNNPVDL